MKRTKSPALNSRIEFLAIEAFKSTGYLIVNKTLIKQFGLLPAILLSNYIDKHIYFREKFPDNDGWFFLTHENQMNQLGMAEYSIRKYKTYLKDKGIIKTTQKGIPAKEWYKIDFQKLVGCLGQDLPKTTGQDPKISKGLYKDTKNKETKKIIFTEQNSSGKVTLQKRNEIYLPIVKYLSKTSQTNKNIQHTSSQLKTWSNDIRRLVENNKVSIKRIKEVLKWYKQNIGGEYIPVIESGSSLREKFTRLEDAMQRGTGHHSKPSSIIESGRKWYLEADGEYYNKDREMFTG